MIINLFTRIFLASDTMKRSNEDKFKYINLSSLKLNYKASNNRLFFSLCNKLIKIEKNTHSYIFLIATPKEFKYIMSRYCSMLNLTYKEYSKMIEHYNLFKEEWCKLGEFDNDETYQSEFINKKSEYKLDYKWVFLTERLLKYIPAEYFVNNAYKEPVGYDKYNAFRIYDIIDELLHLELEIYNSGKELPLIIANLRKNNREELKNVIENNPSIEVELIPIFKEYGYNYKLLRESDYHEYDMDDYIALNTKMGYSALNLFKYNKLLANELKKEKYHITIQDYKTRHSKYVKLGGSPLFMRDRR